MEKDGAVSQTLAIRTCWRILEAISDCESLLILHGERKNTIMSELSNTCS